MRADARGLGTRSLLPLAQDPVPRDDQGQAQAFRNGILAQLSGARRGHMINCTMKRYRAKSPVIEAVQYDGTNAEPLFDFLRGDLKEAQRTRAGWLTII